MTITWRKAPEFLLDIVEMERVNKVIALCKVEDASAIDSHTMSANGPVLNAIFLVNADYIIEVHLSSKHLHFDCGAANALMNYRVTFGVHVPPAEGEAQAEAKSSTATGDDIPLPFPTQSFKFVTVSLKHTDVLVSEMSYFGEDADEWLDFVLNTYPRSLLLT